jgi:hypothetical protein
MSIAARMSSLFNSSLLIIIFTLINLPTNVAGDLSNSTSNERLSWYSAPNYRGTLDIIWSCILTIALCCWTAIHPNIPSPGSSWKHQYLDRTICLLIGTVAPEVFIYLAFIERYNIRAEHAIPPPGINTEHWTITHLLYASMGGFCVRIKRPEIPDKDTLRYLPTTAVYELLRNGRIPSKNFPTVLEIRDKGKSDGIVKAFTLLQILWVLIQSITRRIQHLPLTTLEISTLAYIPCGCCVYWLWWDKPYDIGVPTIIDVPFNCVEVTEDGKARITLTGFCYDLMDYRTYRMTRQCWEDAIVTTFMPINRSGLISGIVFVIVGSIHLSAWNFDFPSEFEQWAWRVCSIVITVSIPVSWLVTGAIMGVAGLASKKDQTVWDSREVDYGKGWNKWMEGIVAAIHGFGVFLYAGARLYLLVEVFLSFRDVPMGVYETTDWTKFIPHV